MLMALSNSDRCRSLRCQFRSYVGNGVRFVILKPEEMVLHWKPFTQVSQRIRKYATLRCSEDRSKDVWKTQHSTRNPLIISIRKPHKPVMAATLSHWLKTIMKSAGIDTNAFSAHYRRSSKLRVQMSASDILKASTFCRFYHRPLNSGLFGSGVLKKQERFKHYHVVNWLCCWSVSGTSKVQLQIPEGL